MRMSPLICRLLATVTGGATGTAELSTVARGCSVMPPVCPVAATATGAGVTGLPLTVASAAFSAPICSALSLRISAILRSFSSSSATMRAWMSSIDTCCASA